MSVNPPHKPYVPSDQTVFEEAMKTYPALQSDDKEVWEKHLKNTKQRLIDDFAKTLR